MSTSSIPNCSCPLSLDRNKTEGFVRIGPEARKPAKVEAVGMQGVKERTCELLLRPCSPTAYTCGLEARGRPFGKRRVSYSMCGELGWVQTKGNAQIFNKLMW